MKANTWKNLGSMIGELYIGLNLLIEYIASADLDQICDDPHMIASVLKSFFSSLPEPIFSYPVCDEVMNLAASKTRSSC